MSDLVPVEQKTVVSYDDEVTAVRMADGKVYVPVRPIIEALGVDWNGQRRRMMRDAVLSKHVLSVDVTSTQGDTPAQRRATLCLPLKYISGFLFGINADRVCADLRQKVIRFQEECYDVLAEAFADGRLSTSPPPFEDLLAQADPESRAAYQMALAVVKLARQQIVIQAEVADHGRRLDLLEAKLGDEERTITEAQAAQVSQAVKAVGLAYGQQTGRNEFGAVYGEMYRKFEVTSYKLIPAAKFRAVMDWLTEWHQSLTGDGPF